MMQTETLLCLYGQADGEEGTRCEDFIVHGIF